MKMKNRYTFIIILVTAILASACTRNASTPPTDVPDEGTPVSSNKELESYLTAVAQQTLDAGNGQGGGSNEAGEVDDGNGEGEDDATPSPTEPVQDPTATPTATFSPEDTPDTYELKKGEFPFCIARRFNVDIAALLSVNKLSKDGDFLPGLVLKIPKDAKKFQGNRMLSKHPTTYTASSSETFYSIACLYGDVTPRAIANANGMKVKDNIQGGTELNIP